MTKYLIIIICLFFTSCAVGPDYIPPKSDDEGQWQDVDSDITTTENINESWWEVFNDPTLNNLIKQAAEHNHDIKIAISSIEEAKSLRYVSIGSFFPSIDFSSNAERQGLSNKTSTNNNSSGQKERDSFNANIDASWEIDIWGGVRREVEAAGARMHAARENKNDVLLSILAEVARNYFEVRGIQKRIAVTEHNIALLNQLEQFAEDQLELGVITEFEVATARGERETVESTLPALEADMKAGIYRISVLTGEKPEYHLNTLQVEEPLPPPPDMIPVGLRSDILRRRPDVRKAERNLAASTAEIGVEIAELFPSFSITGSLSSSASLFSDLFVSDALGYGIGQTISWPLFEGAGQFNRIKASKHIAKGALETYKKTVLEALEEAETSLTRYGKEWQTLKLLKAAEKSRTQAVDIARLRYEAGEENLLTIIEAERSLVLAQDSVIQSEERILTSLTQLYKSLGGGWKVFEK